MWYLYLFLFLSALILTSLVRTLALRKSIIDIPNERSSHTVPTPRGGGLAIVIVWFAGLIYMYFTKQIDQNLFFALASGVILVIVGLLDDIYDLKPIIRFSAQFISATFALYFLGGVKIIDLGICTIENIWLLTPIAFIGIIWFINLFNFLDGIDGYAGMETIFISLVLYFFTSESFYLILVTATLGFLIWNWQPAKIFMGDVGSTLLGFNFAVFALYEQNMESVPIIVFLIISSLFWFDATLTLILRFLNKEKITQAHKKHAYQRIIQSGFSHQKTVVYAVGLNIVNFIIAYLAFQYSYYLVLFLLLNISILYYFFKQINNKRPFDK